MRYNLQREPVWKLAGMDLMLIATVTMVFLYFHLWRPQEGEKPPQPPVWEVTSGTNIGGIGDNGGTVSGADDDEDSVFTKETIKTEKKYTSPNVCVEIIDGVFEEEKTKADYHLADIYIKDVASFRSVFAKDKYGKGIAEETLDMAVRTGAVCAINGDYYGTSMNNLIIRDGELYGYYPKSGDVCVLFRNGAMAVYDSRGFDAETAMKNGAWQAWSFGPSLLDENGEPLTKFNSPVKTHNPRSVVGCFEPGHYCFLAVDGRSKQSAGLTLKQLAKLCHDLGMTCAYNLDGGQTTVMTFGDSLANVPFNDGRSCSDFLCIFDGAGPAGEDAADSAAAG